MEKDITAGLLGEVLRQEYRARDYSARKIDRELKAEGRRGIGKRLAVGKEAQLPLGAVETALAVAEIDPRAYLAMIAGTDLPIGKILEMLQTRKPPEWQRGQKKTLQRVAEKKLRGTSGYGDFRGELRRIEILREDDAEAAELFAWQALEQAYLAENPGGTAGALAVLAAGYPRARAQPLFRMAFDILGDDPTGLVAGKVFGSLSRLLIVAGFPNEAIRVLKCRAVAEVDLFGDGDDRAIVFLNLARAAGVVSDLDLRLACLEQATTSGGERLRFAALQQLAFTVLNLGRDLASAARLYDELVASCHFSKAPTKAKASLKASRMAAHFLAGQLTAEDIPEFEAVYAECKACLLPAEQVSAALDFALYLRAVGHDARARKILEAELWNALGLDEGDAHIRAKYLAACSAAGPPLDPRLDVLRR